MNTTRHTSISLPTASGALSKRITTGCLFLLPFIAVGAYSSANQHADGWYPVADIPENMIEGDVIATTDDFESVILDTLSFPGTAFIEGRLKPEKIKKWADATEERIDKLIGFVYHDSVVMAPTVNCRIESGTFSINSEDRNLIIEIYKSITK